MKILSIHYSQTGQLTQIMEQILSPIKKCFTIDEVRFTDNDAYTFPWGKKNFFDTMPETVLMKKMPLSPIHYQEEKYDLVIFGFQSWFLSLSRPCSSLLQDDEFKKRTRGAKFITVIGARNMWVNAFLDSKKLIEENGCKIIGNIPLVDRNANYISAITIQYWVFTGKKDKMWGIFPKPGISEEDILFSTKYGEIICEKLLSKQENSLQKAILDENKINIPWDVLFIEKRGKKMFRLWASLILNKGKNPFKRNFFLFLYRIYLYVALFTISPIVISIYALVFRPFMLKSESQKKNVILHF
ncbi:MAG: hypothetical protein HYU67_03525 [Flavobacteriia bacterium]|nr:hypothetical protein [Flavobacteriia bacterium]